MKLKRMTIKNIGNFGNDNEIVMNFGASDFVTIIGGNGSGKSTILFLLNFLLNKSARRKGLPTDIINADARENNWDAIVTFEFMVQNGGVGSSNPLAWGGELFIEMKSKYNSDEDRYVTTFFINKVERKEYKETSSLPFDHELEVVFLDFKDNNQDNTWINSQLELGEDKNEVLTKIRDINKNNINEINTIDWVQGHIEDVNTSILSIFSERDFKVRVSVGQRGAMHSRNLMHQHIVKKKPVLSHGDGFSKIMKIIEKIKIAVNKNKKIFILSDEIENHLFYTYQNKVINFLRKEYKKEIIQSIFCTHSPQVVSLNNKSSIIKLFNNKARGAIINSDTNFNYYQTDLSTALFYENIVVVEGHSEKLFFTELLLDNLVVRDYINNKRIGDVHIVCISGVHFKDIVNTLKPLCRNVFIMTDHDMKDGKSTGIKRVMRLLDKVFGIKLEGASNDEIIKEGRARGIFIQKEEGYGFEESLKKEGLIDEKEVEFLKKSKLKNLSSLMKGIEKRITLNSINKDSYIFGWLFELGENEGKKW